MPMLFACFLFLASLLLSGCATPPASIGTPPVQVQAVSARGMVACDSRLAAQAGKTILDRGGNAVDAAIASAFALAVAYPEAGNLGGGGFLVATLADGRHLALDFRERAPLAASHDMYLGESRRKSSLTGHWAAGVPATVAGLWEAHHRYGSLPWKLLLDRAIDLARGGFPVTSRMERTLRADSSRLCSFAGSRQLFFADGHAVKKGSLWRNPDLAATLERIRSKGADGFYSGPTAVLIVAEMQRHGGLITQEDLSSYRAIWRTPIEFLYRGKTVVSMPPPSSGGATLNLICNILGAYNLSSLGWHSPAMIHFTVEAMRRAFAVRNAYFGDPDFVRIPLERFLSAQFADSERATISPEKATPSAQVSFPAGEGMETTHLSVVDAAGNAVSLTTTLNSLYGSGVTVEGAGFLLNNEMDDFAAKPGTPNIDSLVQGEANAIAPGKRMLSSMTPTVVLDQRGKPFLVTGARGGPTIISSVFAVLSNVIDFGMDLPEAVSAPRFHHQHLPDRLEIERGGFPEPVLEKLHSMGYRIKEVADLGSAPSLLRIHDHWYGLGDPRTGGDAEGQTDLP
jgi:gamma-glutamyltranspeptidase/glutathione hydrolase